MEPQHSRREILKACSLATAATIAGSGGALSAAVTPHPAKSPAFPGLFPGLIPLPASIRSLAQKPLPLHHGMTIQFRGPAADGPPLLNYAVEKFRQNFGISLVPVYADALAGKVHVDLALEAEHATDGPAWRQAEAYRLETHSANGDVRLRATHCHGLFNGLLTLLQLAVSRKSGGAPAPVWEIPAVEIQDFPRFEWRGFMLDVSRHFFDAHEVMAVLDAMASLKLNIFHWHLTDDQGWRLPIAKYPRLTEIGAWRESIGFGLKKDQSKHYNSAGKYGGFYSPADIRTVLDYARQRHITVVPELEMPGHCSAALNAYPALDCANAVVPIPSGGIWKRRVAFCASSPRVYSFLEDVLADAAAQFPGPYLHTGGDEVAYGNWQHCPACMTLMNSLKTKSMLALQGYFEQRVADIVRRLGKAMVCWHDNPEFSPEGMIAMAWRMKSPAIAPAMARANHPVISCPQGHMYFDWLPASTPTQKVYAFEPLTPGFTPHLRPLLLGSQANLWTEHVPNLSVVWDRTFPRLCAAAEVFWTARGKRNWADFSGRLTGYRTPPAKSV